MLFELITTGIAKVNPEVGTSHHMGIIVPSYNTPLRHQFLRFSSNIQHLPGQAKNLSSYFYCILPLLNVNYYNAQYYLIQLPAWRPIEIFCMRSCTHPHASQSCLECALLRLTEVSAGTHFIS